MRKILDERYLEDIEINIQVFVTLVSEKIFIQRGQQYDRFEC